MVHSWPGNGEQKLALRSGVFMWGQVGDCVLVEEQVQDKPGARFSNPFRAPENLTGLGKPALPPSAP